MLHRIVQKSTVYQYNHFYSSSFRPNLPILRHCFQHQVSIPLQFWRQLSDHLTFSLQEPLRFCQKTPSYDFGCQFFQLFVCLLTCLLLCGRTCCLHMGLARNQLFRCKNPNLSSWLSHLRMPFQQLQGWFHLCHQLPGFE